PVFSRVHPRFRTPFQVVLMTGLVVALVAGFMPIRQVAELVNVGTLAAFILVSVAVMVLRYTRPDLHRPFRTPLVPLIPLLAIAFCAYLIASLDAVTLWRFVAWMALGMAVYVFYARHHSR
ncbi:MAG TPA: amino acid permease, partial [Gammaproteobacteria bacterium]|nr:amino acid permease [Gammaproteobacteria bacterium]